MSNECTRAFNLSLREIVTFKVAVVDGKYNKTIDDTHKQTNATKALSLPLIISRELTRMIFHRQQKHSLKIMRGEVRGVIFPHLSRDDIYYIQKKKHQYIIIMKKKKVANAIYKMSKCLSIFPCNYWRGGGDVE